jgi:hypothetical protein
MNTVTSYLTAKDKSTFLKFEIKVVLFEDIKYFSIRYYDPEIQKILLLKTLKPYLEHMMDADIFIERNGSIIHQGSINWIGTHGASPVFKNLDEFISDTSDLLSTDKLEIGDILLFVLPEYAKKREESWIKYVNEKGRPEESSKPWIDFFFVRG